MPLLVLQQGHVARTSGATGGPHEQATARAVAADVVRLMPHAGWTVRVIGADEPAARYRGDAFVAVHTDAAGNPSARGASVGYRNDAGRALGAAWKAAYAEHGWEWDFRADNYTAALSGYYGHRHAVDQGNPRAVIVELGFTTNPIERERLTSSFGRRVAALSIVKAVTGSVPVSGTPTPPTAPAPAPVLEDDMLVRIDDSATVYQVVGPALVPLTSAVQAEVLAGAGWRDKVKQLTSREAGVFYVAQGRAGARGGPVETADRLQQGLDASNSTPLGAGRWLAPVIRWARDQGADLDKHTAS